MVMLACTCCPLGMDTIIVVATSRETIFVLIVNVAEVCPPAIVTVEGKLTYGVPV